jgi:hypothetical protein
MTQPPTGESPLPRHEAAGPDRTPYPARLNPPQPYADPQWGPPALTPTPGPYPGAVGPDAGTAPAGRPPRRRRGLLIASIVFAVVLLLCASGGVTAFFLLRDTEEREGAPEPVAAVDAFMRAVYTDQDATKAAALVCSDARDEAAIRKKVEEVERYATTYTSPRFQWSPPQVDDQGDEVARVSTVLTMTTGDEQVAEQRLTFQVVNKTGWWVCEVGG